LRQVESKFLTIEEVATRWNVKTKWLYSNHSRLRIPNLTLGRQLRFPIRQLEQWETDNLQHFNELKEEKKHFPRNDFPRH
jgi:hypothetical protein